MHRPRPTLRRSGGFTVIELLTVVAVIGILLTILIPTLGKVQENAKKTKTRVQFSQWATAIEGFRQEYGYYPNFKSVSTDTLPFSNGIVDSQPESTRFIEALSGRKLDGTTLAPDGPGELAGNKKHIAFCGFAQDQINSTGILQDAFALPSPQIVVLMDGNLDGLITFGTSGTDFPSGLPGVGPTSTWRPQATSPIRAGVIFYSAGAGTSNSDVVTSW